MMRSQQSLTLVDAHVHLRRCFEPLPFIKAACSNFASAGRTLDPASKWVGVLCLTSAPGERGFERLKEGFRDEGDSERSASGWQVEPSKEPTSFRFVNDGRVRIVAINGQQIVSKEGLEVLAIGASPSFEGGRPVIDTILAIARCGALPVVPWGVGKWVGRRGQLVEGLIRNSALPAFFLGDSANRPALWPRPSLFDRATQKGINNLPGSDPLPLPGEVYQVGSFGGVFDRELEMDRPAEDLKRKLRDPRTVITPYGTGERPARFIRNQVRMQYRKHLRA